VNREASSKRAPSSGPQGTTLFRADDLQEALRGTEESAEASVDKPLLIGSQGPFEGQRFVLGKGRSSIGRRQDNDIVLPESSISSMHAWIIGEGGQWRVMNMLSTNGTFVNDEKIHEAPIHDGDRVRFGAVEFIFRTREGEEGDEDPGDWAAAWRRHRWMILAAAGALLLALLLWFW